MGLFPVFGYSNYTINIHVQIFVLGTCIFVSFGCIPISGALGSYVKSVSKASIIYIPTGSGNEHSDFFTSSPALVIICLFCSHSSRCEVIIHGGFVLHFPDGYWYWEFFLWVYWTFVYLLWNITYLDLLPILKNGIIFCYCVFSYGKLLYMFWIQVPC